MPTPRRRRKRPDPDDYRAYAEWLRKPTPPKVPTGRLTLTMKNVRDVGRMSWTDDKPKKLEACLNMFVRALICAAEVVRNQRLEWEAREKIWREEEERRERQEREQAEYSGRVQRLSQELSGWRGAAEIRAYVAEVRRLVSTGSTATTEMDQWLQWALKRADNLDPLSTLRRKSGSPVPT